MADQQTEFLFDEEKQLGVYTCSKVWDDGSPVLMVSHDGDGDWQFLCGGQHEEGGGDEIRLVCLEHIVERDPSVNQVAGLCRHWTAERDSAADAWELFDGLEQIIRENVDEYGVHVMSVHGGEGGGGFSYSIGLWKTLGVPEVLCLGLPAASAHGIINHIANLVREGAKLRDGDERHDVLNDYPCRFRTLAAEHFDEHMGYANWFYEGKTFPVLQLVYPDREGRFPGEEGTSDTFNTDQPILWA